MTHLGQNSTFNKDSQRQSSCPRPHIFYPSLRSTSLCLLALRPLGEIIADSEKSNSSSSKECDFQSGSLLHYCSKGRVFSFIQCFLFLHLVLSTSIPRIIDLQTSGWQDTQNNHIILSYTLAFLNWKNRHTHTHSSFLKLIRIIEIG